jgi:hypothetical protein
VRRAAEPADSSGNATAEVPPAPVDGYPRNFLDSRTFFTLGETDMGLLQVRVWEFACVAGPQ